MDAQHALKTNGRASVTCLGIVGSDHFPQRRPGHDEFSRFQKALAPRGLAVLLRGPIGSHGERLKFHPHKTLHTTVRWTLISIALGAHRALARVDWQPGDGLCDVGGVMQRHHRFMITGESLRKNPRHLKSTFTIPE